MAVDLVIFDLDGTLVDSKQDLAQAVNAARAEFGLAPLDLALIGRYVGDGAPTLLRRAMGPEAGDEDVRKALEFFLAYYGEHELDHTRAYPGVPEALEALEGGGVRMAVLTNKPVNMSRRILEGLDLARYFARVYGGNSFARKKPDPQGVGVLLEELAVPKDRTLMAGDSAVDVKTARNAGIRVCGVTYGFQPETFADHPPDMMVDRPEELARAVLAEGRSKGKP
jgi:phosphoglycolate phosphatase